MRKLTNDDSLAILVKIIQTNYSEISRRLDNIDSLLGIGQTLTKPKKSADGPLDQMAEREVQKFVNDFYNRYKISSNE